MRNILLTKAMKRQYKYFPQQPLQNAQTKELKIMSTSRSADDAIPSRINLLQQPANQLEIYLFTSEDRKLLNVTVKRAESITVKRVKALQ